MKSVYAIVFILTIFILGGCLDGTSSSLKGSKENLLGENISFLKPVNMKRSSRNSLAIDFPALGEDSIQLQQLQRAIDELSSVDPVVDIFVDSLKSYHAFIVCNLPRLELSDTDYEELKGQMERSNAVLEEMNAYLVHSPVEALIKENDRLQIAKFKYSVQNNFSKTKLYRNIFYVNAEDFSALIYEFNEFQADIEDYLWTFKRDISYQ